MISLSLHARERIAERMAARGITSEREVLEAVNQLEDQIIGRSREVRVIVKTLKAAVYLPDGSNGDTVIACVDPERRKVKTVMLQRSSQIRKKAREVTYL